MVICCLAAASCKLLEVCGRGSVFDWMGWVGALATLDEDFGCGMENRLKLENFFEFVRVDLPVERPARPVGPASAAGFRWSIRTAA